MSEAATNDPAQARRGLGFRVQGLGFRLVGFRIFCDGPSRPQTLGLGFWQSLAGLQEYWAITGSQHRLAAGVADFLLHWFCLFLVVY